MKQQPPTTPQSHRRHALRTRAFIAAAALLGASLALAGPAGATSAAFTVTTTTDSGPGSLRQAIANADAASATPRRVVFHIPTADPGFNGTVFTIAPTSALPALTHDISIDGATQTAFTGNTNTVGPEVVLSGGDGKPPASFAGIFISGDRNTVGNLVVNGFATAIGATWGTDNTPSANQFLNNYLGTDPTGTSAVPNANGVTINGFASPGIQADANVISGNIISGNAHGIGLCDASNTQIVSNRVGVDRTGANPLGNGGDGIVFVCAGVRDTLVKFNTIAFNAGDGIFDQPDYRYCATCHQNNRFTRNSIHDNTGLAINLSPPPFGVVDGVTANDAGDTDTGGNGLQNFPVITAASSDSSATAVNGTLNSTANTTFNVELYANTSNDPSGNGEAQRLIGGVAVTTDASGNATFAVLLVPRVIPGVFISATATDSTGNTSELSASLMVTATT